MVFEGIVISKQPYKERDLIVKLLLRNGMMGSFYIYGGQGGGKKQKPSAFDIATMMKIQIKDRKVLRQDVSELMIAAEHQRIWEPLQIRHNIQSFYLTCLYFEIIQKFGINYHPDDSGITSDHEGVFSVVSNALFYMDEALVKNHFIPEQHLSLFMVKLLYQLGIIPDTEQCGYCGASLFEEKGASFLIEQGQFACLQCVTGENEKGLLFRIRLGTQTKYQDYEKLIGASFHETDKLIRFFCHHFHLKPIELKSYSLLYK
ncbi:MAG TPA: DNA repair protein RecO C-terminal domain-containing protein [Bacteriovoracaceae bacterium]|nr:DNA repair protein RecO C-terminal domain-containing protein [Bacteriovoracaceae bacterium]